jgi:hypothetical protein
VAERLGVQDLVKLCERALVDLVARPGLRNERGEDENDGTEGGGDDDDNSPSATWHTNALALGQFAADYNLPRLKRHCDEVLSPP